MIVCFILLTITITNIHNLILDLKNGTRYFKIFMKKYNKSYKNDDDRNFAFINYVENENLVTNLNMENKDKDSEKYYLINENSDWNAEEFQERYRVSINTYDVITSKTARQNQIKPSKIHIDSLYDLADASDIYKAFIEKYQKKNATNHLERKIRYLRFVKTLVDLNRKNYEDGTDLTYDEDADKLLEPDEYYYR